MKLPDIQETTQIIIYLATPLPDEGHAQSILTDINKN